jgi:tetratricopeptide (TPR) repeat protein
VRYIKRSLTLAPNLAYAHAALAMVQNFPPESEAELQKAVALDPGSADAWTWLGNLYISQNRLKEAVAAQTRAVEIEPLWWTAVGNKIGALVVMRDKAGLDAELRRIQQTTDAVLLTKARWRIANVSGYPGDGAALLLRLRAERPEEAPWVDMRVAGSLMQLGFIEEGLHARKLPLERAAEFRGTPLSPEALDAKYKTADDFWADTETAARYSQLLPTHGRLSEWLTRYRARFRSADDFVASFTDRSPALLSMAPTVAANLRAAGDEAEADALLRRTEPAVLGYVRNGPPNIYLLATAAFFRAADGKGDEAIILLGRAVGAGWLPDAVIDIAQEPCFLPFVNRPDFQAVRQRILARIAEERRKITHVMLANSGLGSKLAA